MKTTDKSADGGNRGAVENYIAKNAYRDPSVVRDYEETRFSGPLGRYRHLRERRGVGAMLDLLPSGLSVLDCPCGNGRWWSVLDPHAESILGMDTSPAMLEAAESRESDVKAEVALVLGEAEALPLEDAAVDLVFSHALTKHLPIRTQQRVLSEFARVTREWVVSSFSILTPIAGSLWKRRDFVDSNPVSASELGRMAEQAGLRIEARRRCTTPVGVEFSVLFRKTNSPS